MFGCCATVDKVEREQHIPPVIESPDRINAFLKRLMREGLRAMKVTHTGASQRKVFVADKHMTKLSYAPTSKKEGSSFPIRNIWRIDTGMEATEGLRRAKLHEGEDFPVSLTMRDGTALNVVLDSDADQSLFAASMAFLVRTRRAVMDEDPHRMRLIELWIQADRNGDRRLSFKELADIMELLNVDIDRSTLKLKFQQADKDGNGTLDFAEFNQFYTALCSRPELRPVFDGFTTDPQKHCMTEEDLQAFLRTAQGENVSAEVVHRIAQLCRGSSVSRLPSAEPVALGFEEFVRFLINPARNGWANPLVCDQVYQDMTLPLQHYFIASSHNTYLSGDQLQSDSKTDMYKYALISGCRCVELDCWDGDGNEPVIYHGYTRTSKIFFRDVLTTIRDFAFATSPYPVVLSLEVHTGKAQSNVMATLIRSIFGDDLYTFADAERDNHTKWSPEALKHKILVKWKLTDEGDDDEKEIDGAQEIVEARMKADKEKGKDEKGKKHDHGDLGRTVMVAAMKTKSWGADAQPYHIMSIAEGRAIKISQDEPQNFRLMNTRMLTRIYPAGSRINSSNYDPTVTWEHGAQCVALNYQTWDEWMRINDAKFCVNARCGYVLKPAYLRDATLPRPSRKQMLRVVVILGSQLPKPNAEVKGEIIDPYVIVRVRGTQADNAANSVGKTKVIDNNGFNPVWNEAFEFSVTDPELAFVVLEVWDKDSVNADDAIGSATISIGALRQGYRAVPLKAPDEGRALEHASLLCHFSLFDDSAHRPQPLPTTATPQPSAQTASNDPAANTA